MTSAFFIAFTTLYIASTLKISIYTFTLYFTTQFLNKPAKTKPHTNFSQANLPRKKRNLFICILIVKTDTHKTDNRLVV